MKKILCILLTSAFLLIALVSCGSASNGSSEPHVHSYGDWVITLQPTCTEEGRKVRSCACGAEETASVPATGHTVVRDAEVPATAISTGLTGGSHCSVCGAVITDQKTIPATLVTSEGMFYILIHDDTEYEVSGIGMCTDKNIVIPDTFQGKKVTRIGNYAFKDCTDITGVTIPDSVTSIGNGSFFYCTGLTSVSFGNSIESIGNSAFWCCTGLTAITIPDSVVRIEAGAFEGCEGLLHLDIGKNVNSIGAEAFCGCSGLTEILLPDGVDCVGESVFYDCTGLVYVTLPDQIREIGESAFARCTALTGIAFSDQVTSIGKFAFNKDGNLTEITFGGTLEEWNSVFRGASWDLDTGAYTVHCTDGDISKS